MGHDAHSHAVEDGAVRVALLADLRKPQLGLSGPENGPERQRAEINAADQQVFPESPVRNRGAPAVELLHLFIGKKADLAVPWAYAS